MSQLINLNCGIDIAAAEGASPKRFSMVAYTGSPMRINGYAHPVYVDLSGLTITEKSRPILKDHSPSMPVGHTDAIRIAGSELHVEGVISGAGPVAKEIVEAAGNGFPWQASVGVSPSAIETVAKGSTAIVNGQTIQGPAIIARKAMLKEISFVALGADDNTTARIAAGSTNGVLQMADENVSQNDQVKAETLRIEKIEALCANHPDIAAKAIEEGWDLAKAEIAVLRAAEIAVLRASRPRISAVRMDRPDEAGIIEASLCLSTGMTEDQVAEHFDERTIDAAMSREHRGAGLSTLLFAVANAGGKHVRPGNVTDQVIRAAFEAERDIQASGYSTFSLSGILSNVGNKNSLAAYQSVESAASRISATRSVKDFKTHTSYRLTGSGMFEKVGPGGQLKHATLTEASYTNKAETFGKMFGISRQDMINDDLGAFNQISSILGRQAALAKEDAVFTLWLSNPGTPKFFSTSDFGNSGSDHNANYIKGAGTTLQISSLTTAEQAFIDQTDDDGKPILVRSKFLLVPSSLKVTAQQLMNTVGLVGGSSTVLNSNPHAGKWDVIVSPYLNAQGISGSSSTAWYVMADPADLAAVEIAYLNGNSTPTIETAQMDFATLGVQMRGYFDFGVALVDPRAAVMSKGAA